MKINWSADAAEHHRRIVELERADAQRSAVEACIAKLSNHTVKSEPYRKAFKRAIRLLMDLKIEAT